MPQNLKRVLLLILAGIMLCSGNVFAQGSDSGEDLSSETETAQEEKPEQKYRIDYMDEIEWYDSGKFMDGVTVAERDVLYKDSIDLLLDLGFYMLKDDYDAIKSKKTINTTNEDYSKYEKSVTYSDFYYILGQIVTRDMELSDQYKKSGNEDRINMEYAVECMAELLGYGSFKDAVGIQKIISDNELLKGIGGYQPKKNISFGELSVLILNTFEAYGVEQSYLGTNISISPSGKKFMERSFDIYKVSGFVNAAGSLNVYKNKPMMPGEVEIDRTRYNSGTSGAEYYFGQNVTVYFYSKDDENTILHIHTYKDESITEDLHNVEYSGGKLTLYRDETSGGKEYKRINAGDIQYVMYNGVSSKDISVMEKINGKDGTIMLSSSNNNGKYDTAVINVYSYVITYSVSTYEERIYLRNNATINGQNYLNMKDYDEILCTLNGKTVEYGEIATGATLRIISCPENKYIRIDACDESVKGKIEALKDYRVKINGKEYRISETYLSSPESVDFAVGDYGEFYVSADGYIAGYEKGNAMAYAFLYRVYSDEMTEDVFVEMYNQQGKWVKYPLKNKNIEIDGKRFTDNEASIYLKNSNVEKSVCRYKVNSSDQIVFLDTLVDEPEEKQDENRMRLAYEGNVKLSWYCEWFRSDIGYRVRSKTVVFEIPDDVDKKENYAVKYGVSLNQDEKTIFLEMYNPNAMNICDVAVIGEQTKSLSDEVRQLFFCESLSEIYDETEEEMCYAINGKVFMINQGLGEEVSQTLKISAGKLEEFEKNYPGVIHAGTVINFEENSSGYLTALEPLIYNCKIPEDFHIKDNVYYQKFAGTITAVDMDDGYFSVEASGNVIISNLNCCICIDSKTTKARSIGLGDLVVGERIYVIRTAGGARFAVVVR